jgi:hypothetical protein
MSDYQWTEVSVSWSITDWGDWPPEKIEAYLRAMEREGCRITPLEADQPSSETGIS